MNTLIPPVFVVGPQRSGTTIAARILAKELKKTYLDESEYRADSVPDNAVIQAPFLSKYVIELSYRFPGSEFVFVWRSKQEIIDSMNRIEWYKDYIDDPNFYSVYIDSVYDMFKSYKLVLDKSRYIDLFYDSLKTHPLFVHDRTDFTTRQWEKEKPEGPKNWRNEESSGTYKIRL